MEKKVISVSTQTKNGLLDDDYTLLEDGSVIHSYDKHGYPGGYNRKEELKGVDLPEKVKKRLFDCAAEENKDLVRALINYISD